MNKKTIKLVGVRVKRPAKKVDASYEEYAAKQKWYEDSGFKKLRQDMKAATKKFGGDDNGIFRVDFEFDRINLSCTAAIEGPSVSMYILNNSVYTNSLKENMEDVDKYLDKLQKQAKLLKQAKDYAEKTAAKFQKTIDGFSPEMKKQIKQW